MIRSLSDQQVETVLYHAVSCPDCEGMTSPDDCGDWSSTAVWVCQDDDGCGWHGTARDLAENALRAAGILMRDLPPPRYSD